jgi:hypothetical protein
MTITYPMEIPSQTYHEELRKAQHAYDLATIASRRHFDYTTFRQPRPGRVITNPINNGQRPFQTSVEGTSHPLQVYPGGLGTFVMNQHHLRGGVLSSIEGQKYARNILDRRASQIRQMENPDLPPPEGKVLSTIEADKLEMYGLLHEVIDNVESGNYTDLVFGNIRRLTAILVKVSTELDTDDYQNIYDALKEVLRDEKAEATMSQHHGSVPASSFIDRRRRDAKYRLVEQNLEKLLGFMEELIGGDIGNLPEASRRLLVRSALKHWNLSSISTVAPRALKEKGQPRNTAIPPDFPHDDGDGGDDGYQPPTSPPPPAPPSMRPAPPPPPNQPFPPDEGGEEDVEPVDESAFTAENIQALREQVRSFDDGRLADLVKDASKRLHAPGASAQAINFFSEALPILNNEAQRRRRASAPAPAPAPPPLPVSPPMASPAPRKMPEEPPRAISDSLKAMGQQFRALYRADNIPALQQFARRYKLFRSDAGIETKGKVAIRNRFNQRFPSIAFD